MKIELMREEMLIIPENVPEKVYLEEVFKLKSDGDTVIATRKDGGGISFGDWAHLGIKKVIK